MSRITKWKLEKTKVKVVFRLQFHATHIQSGWDKLFISFLPADSGKATAKTTKANVKNGTCKWADPIYETTRLLQDSKSKQYDEKLYKLVVAMGSSRASILGEAIINLADYADALKPSVVSLPLQGCNSGTTLHVTVQLLTSKTGFREFEQQRELRDRGLQAGYKHDGSPGKGTFLEEIVPGQMDKATTRFRLTSDARELSSVEEDTGNEECADSSIGFEGSSNTSESLYTEKHDTSSPNEIDGLKAKIAGDMNGVPHCPSTQTHKGDPSNSQIMPHGSESVHGWVSDYSMENDIAIAYEENIRLRGNLELAESSIFELKLEVSSLQSKANDIGIETEKFTHLLADELFSCEELAKEVSLLKSELSQYKDDIEKLKCIKLTPQITSRRSDNVEFYHLLKDIQLQWMTGILAVEDRIREVQSKAYLGFHDRDPQFFHSELEALLNSLQDLKQGTGESISLVNVVSPERADVRDLRETSLHKGEKFAPETGFELEVCEPEIMLQHFSIPPLVSQETDSIDAMDAMKRNLVHLIRELDEGKLERDSLARKMGQMECYYEALIHELEENQKQMLGELQNLRNEHSTCLYKISTGKVEMENMHHDMNEQILHLAEERHNLDTLNKELERRAATSEAALKRARLNYSIAVDKLQKDLETLSSQVVSMFQTNENLIKQAFSETSYPLLQGDPNAPQHSEVSDATRWLHYQNQYIGVRKQLGGDILLEDLKKSLCLQEELYQKVEEELREMHSANLHLDIFSKTLQETLWEANAGISIVKAKMDELEEQLRLSNESKDLLMLRLQVAMDDIHNLTDYKASCTAKCNDMASQNHILEAKLESASMENALLVQKIAEWEVIMMECRSYQSQYEACLAEKTELYGLLVHETSVNSKLQNEISILNEELVALNAKIVELSSQKDNLEETVRSVQEKVTSLLVSYEKHLSGLSLLTDTHSLNSKTNDCNCIIMQLQEIQQNTCSKVLQLMEENRSLENERLAAVVSLDTVQSELLAMKKKFKNDIHDAVFKLDVTNAIVNNLQVKLEFIANKFQQGSGIEEEYAEKHRELFVDLAMLEVELQKLLSKDGNLLQEISSLNTLSGELEVSKLTIAGLIQEKQDLVVSLQDKTTESAKLASEIGCLKENFSSLHDELDAEKGIKGKLESAVEDLTSQLEIEKSKLHDLAQQNSELLHFRQLAIDQELEKSRLSDLLLQRDKIVEKLQAHSSYLIVLENQLSEMHEYIVTADVKSTLLVSQLRDLELENCRLCNLLLQRDKEVEKLQAKSSSLIGLEGRLSEMHEYIIASDVKISFFTSQLIDSDVEKSRLSDLLLQRDKFVEKLQSESSSMIDLESQLSELHEYLINADVKITFYISLYETRIQELEQKLRSCDVCFKELQKKHHDLDVMLKCFCDKESCYTEENAKLGKSIESIRFELEASVAQNKALSEANNVKLVELHECKRKLAELETRISEDKDQYLFEAKELKNTLLIAEEEILDLTLYNEQLEISIILLKGKLEEQHACATLLKDCEEELTKLHHCCTELSDKLSAQTMRAEEFKNLSIHLKELKDKAEAECLLAQEKREPEGPPVAMQESLRIAFIKEQYETKFQELKQQLAISKKHGEEMLLKLQDAVDEIESRKRSEALHSKRNEELGLRIIALEDELQSLLSDNRENIKACDWMKAELECAVLSLECCREEKQKLETSLQECEKENSRVAAELSLAKRQLEYVASSISSSKEESEGKDKAQLHHQPNESTANSFPNSIHCDSLGFGEKVEDSSLVQFCKSEALNAATETQSLQEDAACKDLFGIPEQGVLSADLQQTDASNNYYCLRTNNLMSSIKHLHEELERMKNENSLISDDHHFDLDCQVLQNEVMRLNKANEELRSIFPLYNEVPSTGNALERVLALEIELAETLRAKHKSKIHFQSSFLKQHPDEEAVLKSFRDINELIREMLEVKGQYAAVEAELKEMHDRYSQLSLQLAEVEGDRQKLKMTLKNVRASRKVTHLNCSSSAANADLSS